MWLSKLSNFIIGMFVCCRKFEASILAILPYQQNAICHPRGRGQRYPKHEAVIPVPDQISVPPDAATDPHRFLCTWIYPFEILLQSPTPWSHPNWTRPISGMKVAIEWQALCFHDIIMHYECTYTMSQMSTLVTLLKMGKPSWYFVIINSG